MKRTLYAKLNEKAHQVQPPHGSGLVLDAGPGFAGPAITEGALLLAKMESASDQKAKP
jgi:hypothetical protein